VTCAVNARVSDSWLLPILRDLLPEKSLELLECNTETSYWKTSVAEALVTDDEILGAVSARARVGIASDLLVSSEALEKVPLPGRPAQDMIYRDQSFTSDPSGSQ
jgi:hypothetical protein